MVLYYLRYGIIHLDSFVEVWFDHGGLGRTQLWIWCMAEDILWKYINDASWMQVGLTKYPPSNW